MFSPSPMIAHRHDEYISNTRGRGRTVTDLDVACELCRRQSQDAFAAYPATGGRTSRFRRRVHASGQTGRAAASRTGPSRRDRAAIGQCAVSTEDAAGAGTQPAAAGSGRATESSGRSRQLPPAVRRQSADAAASGPGRCRATANGSGAPAEHHRSLQRHAAAVRSSRCSGHRATCEARERRLIGTSTASHSVA